jgi:hypothetical protein
MSNRDDEVTGPANRLIRILLPGYALMPLAKKNYLSKGRMQFEGSLTAAEVDSLATDPQLRVLQTSSPVEFETWDLLNGKLFSVRHDVDLRVYGFHSSGCDLSFLSRLGNLRRFSADCLKQARGVEHIAALENLRSLSVGIYGLENFDFLASLPDKSLRELFLGATKSKKPSLRLLERFGELRKLQIEGQQRDIDVISKLCWIEDVTLRSISVDGLSFLNGLSHLWSLDIKLGGTNDLSALEGMDGIKYLELWQVRGLRDISVISAMHGLQYLFLQSLPHIHSIPDLSKLIALKRVHLESMKGLRDISALSKAPALAEFVHLSAQGMEPAQYADLLTCKKLTQFFVGFGSETKNKIPRDLATQAGIKQYERTQFSFT